MSYRRYKDFDSVLQAVSGSTVLQRPCAALDYSLRKPHTQLLKEFPNQKLDERSFCWDSSTFSARHRHHHAVAVAAVAAAAPAAKAVAVALASAVAIAVGVGEQGKRRRRSNQNNNKGNEDNNSNIYKQ